MVLAAVAFAEHAAGYSRVEALAVLFQALCLLALAPLLHVLEVHPQLKAALLGIVVIECSRVPRQGLYDGLLLLR